MPYEIKRTNIDITPVVIKFTSHFVIYTHEFQHNSGFFPAIVENTYLPKIKRIEIEKSKMARSYLS